MLSGFEGKSPKIHRTAFVHPQAIVIGDVRIGKHSSVWPGAVLRGDFAKIEIGKYTCIQDNAVIHPADFYEENDPKYVPVEIGDYVIVGHQALIHGATIGDECLIGGGAIVFDESKIRKNAMVGMGGLVIRGAEVPRETIVVGIPARPLRGMEKSEIERIRIQAENYAKLAERHKRNLERETDK